VAVVVNPEEALLKRLQEAACFDAIQFHGDETPEFCVTEGAAFSYWIKALRVRSEEDLAGAAQFPTPFLLLDAAVPGSYGGSGKTLDWGLAAKFVKEHPELRVILAGGLNPENVSTAIAQVNPHAVDVASGVESSPGKKDIEKVRSFVSAAR
jgi:phosphoribosylanthranilate isomerase